MLRPDVMEVPELTPEPTPGTDSAVDSPDLVRVALRWLPAVLFGAVLVVVVRKAAAPLDNLDTYFHLRFGSEFLHGHWSLWHPGSVTPYATSSWVPTQWLPEMAMAQVAAWFGLAGVAWLFGLMLLALVCALYFVTRRWANPMLVVFLLIPTLVGASFGLSMRPQVLSYLLVVITLGAWLRTWDDHRLRWWLIPLTWLWAMMHGMWPIGIALGVVAVVGLALDRRTDVRGLGRALLIPFASAVAAALTPLGPSVYDGVRGVGERSRFFAEWNPPSYTSVPTWLVLAATLAVCVVLLIRGPRPPWTDVVFLLVTAGCAVWSLRTVPIAAVMLMPLVARAARPMLAKQPGPVRRREAYAVVGANLVALAVLAAAVPHTSADPPAQPSWLDPAMTALPPHTPIVSEWAYAGYLMWKYPDLDQVMHGYGDTYTVPELQRNEDILTIAPGWDRELRSTNARVAVLPTHLSLAYALEHQEGWRVVHRSPSLEMLVAPPGWSASD